MRASMRDMQSVRKVRDTSRASPNSSSGMHLRAGGRQRQHCVDGGRFGGSANDRHAVLLRSVYCA